MAKRQMSSEEGFDLRQAMHVAILDALVASRRWEPGELVFHGGTSLHLAYNSPRFSEDLDFMITAPLKALDLAEAVRSRLGRPVWVPGDMDVAIDRVREEGSMRTFVVTLRGGDVMGAAKVKVEFWKATPNAVGSLRTVVAPIQLPRGAGSEFNPYIVTAAPDEIMADKVFAMGGRPYTKARDIFDIHWLNQYPVRYPGAAEFSVRFGIYKVGGPEQWLKTARNRRQELLDDPMAIATGLRPWLPSYWPLTEASVGEMIATSVNAVDYGLAVVAEMIRAAEPDPSP